MPGTIVESVTLNFTDLTGSKTGCAVLGSNKFWKARVVDNGDGTADFLCQWGPTGSPGSDKGSVRGTTLQAALDQLHKKSREKQNKGYTLLETRSDAEELAKAKSNGITATLPAPSKAAKAALVTSAPATQVHPEVGRLLGIIYNETSKAVRAGLSAQAGATADNPIGNLSDRQLDVGGSILDEIEGLLSTTFGRESVDNRTTQLPLVGCVPSRQIIDLTERYMSNVPRELKRDQRGRENLHRTVISTFERLDEQRKFLQLLRDAHLSQEVFKAAGAQTTESGKEQVWLDGLNCHIEYCAPGTADFVKVSNIFATGQSKQNANWWRNGRSTLKIARVFKFVRNGTDPRFTAYASRILAKPGAVGKINAYHGTKTPNILGISRSGLLLPENLPRGINRAGAAFGKGIYHAPAFHATGHTKIGTYPTQPNGALKSMNYTSAQGAYYGSGNTSHNAFMFLQEVALGLPDIRTSACWDKARPEGWPTKDFIFACGTNNTGGFVHDEIVTFSEDAQIFRYLLEIEVL